MDAPGFLSATVHQPEDTDGFEFNIGVADLDDGPVANFSYNAPTLHSAAVVHHLAALDRSRP